MEIKCNLCPYKTKRKSNLKRHFAMVHDGNKYKCPVCKAIVKNLQQHLRNIHDVKRWKETVNTYKSGDLSTTTAPSSSSSQSLLVTLDDSTTENNVIQNILAITTKTTTTNPPASSSATATLPPTEEEPVYCQLQPLPFSSDAPYDPAVDSSPTPGTSQQQQDYPVNSV